MRRSCLWIALLATVTALPPSLGAQMDKFRPVTDERLRRSDDEPGNWFVYRRSWNQWAHSPLTQINRDNIHQLTLAWSSSMNPGANEQEPLVIDGVMYLLHGEAEALDARTGASLWRFKDDVDKVATESRSLSVYRDKVIFGANATRAIGLNAVTGKKIWDSETFAGLWTTPSARKAHRFSAGPNVGNGKVFIATNASGGTRPAYVSGLDVETGKVLWRREGVAGADDSQEARDSWGGIPQEMRLKVSFWGTGSYDPKSNTTYWGTASASPYPEILKGTKGGDVKWSNSTLAINADTGKLVWAFQHLPRDNWDQDHMGTRMYADGLRVQPDPAALKWFNPALKNGQTRDVIFAMGKPGILWALDRNTGEFLWARENVFQEYYKDIDGRGKVTLNEAKIFKSLGESINVCPGMRGGGLWQSMSYSPATNTIFLSVHQFCHTLTVVEGVLGLDWSKQFEMPGSKGNLGKLVAVDASTGKTRWTYEQRSQMWSTLSTASGLVFVGDSYRNLMAFDQRTGEKVWEVPLSGPVLGNPITYAVNGRQYLAVTTGGQASGDSFKLTPEVKATPGNNVVMVFALPAR